MSKRLIYNSLKKPIFGKREFSSNSGTSQAKRFFNPALLLMASGVGAYTAYSYKTDLSSHFGTKKIVCEAESSKFLDDPHLPMRDRMSSYIKNLQTQITTEISRIDGKPFKVDRWQRALGGEGISCVLEDGKVFERAGCNISIVHGKLPKPAVKQMRAEASDQLEGDGPFPFFTASISLVFHPRNPMAPTVHLNYRYFEVENPQNPGQTVWWFGGGSDLTPAYLFEEDAKHFHTTLKQACDKNDNKFYPEFKTWCDKYFMNTHRSESRGIGGIFFDDLDDKHGDRENLFKFVQSCGDAFLPSYIPILNKRKDMKFTEAQKEWQQLRRGRYVEFNLIHDRGTKFGLFTPNPRIESILVSLPLTARWQYNIVPESGSEEEKLVKVLKSPREWA